VKDDLQPIRTRAEVAARDIKGTQRKHDHHFPIRHSALDVPTLIAEIERLRVVLLLSKKVDMPEIRFEIARMPEPTCGAMSSTSKNAMRCELPPGHYIQDSSFGPLHYGRDRRGTWRTWAPKKGS
jgi:hypothetical protein